MAMVLDNRVMDETLDVAPISESRRSVRMPEGNHPETNDTPRILAHTVRFGVLEVEEDLVITFPEGIIGFDSCHRFLVVHNDARAEFRWLQSMENPSVAFPIVEPVGFRPDYAPTISDTDARFLELNRDIPTLMFVIVTIPALNPRAMTANLLGPLVINPVTRQGKQVIVQDEGYTTKHSIVEELARTAQGISVDSKRTKGKSVTSAAVCKTRTVMNPAQAA